jgi:hypothetical protein
MKKSVEEMIKTYQLDFENASEEGKFKVNQKVNKLNNRRQFILQFELNLTGVIN